MLRIYNEGIEDRIATLETQTKDIEYMRSWFDGHQGRYGALIAERDGEIIGWASLNPYLQRCAYQGVAELSVYIAREHRGQGVGSSLLTALEQTARERHFHKTVLFALPFNARGMGMYRKLGYRQVGVFERQGVMDGRLVDVAIMEKLL